MQRIRIAISPRPQAGSSAGTVLRRFDESCSPPGASGDSAAQPLELAAAIDRAFRATGHSALRDLSIQVVEGLVILQGRVPTYYLKQKAQSEALQVLGVSAVRNELDVVDSTRAAS